MGKNGNDKGEELFSENFSMDENNICTITLSPNLLKVIPHNKTGTSRMESSVFSCSLTYLTLTILSTVYFLYPFYCVFSVLEVKLYHFNFTKY